MEGRESSLQQGASLERIDMNKREYWTVKKNDDRYEVVDRNGLVLAQCSNWNIATQICDLEYLVRRMIEEFPGFIPEEEFEHEEIEGAELVSFVSYQIREMPSIVRASSAVNQSVVARTSYVPEEKPATFRPRRNQSPKPGLKFIDSSSTTQSISTQGVEDIDGLHDAFTGVPLDKALGLYQCGKCKVYYHKESFELLKEENRSQCVSCQSKNIAPIDDVLQAAREKASKNTSYC